MVAAGPTPSGAGTKSVGHGMTQPAKAGEPSMEEILASIRRIIADDEAAKSLQAEVQVSGGAAAGPAQLPTPEADAPGRRSVDLPEPAVAPKAPPRSGDALHADVTERAAAAPIPAEMQLLSTETKAAVDSAFNALAQAVRVRNTRTLEDSVHDMLRPMLKSWLDENLPGLVERLVRAEIERASRGR